MPAGKARALEPRPGARAAEPPRPGPQRAGSEPRSSGPQLWRPAGSVWGLKKDAGRRKLGQFLVGHLKLRWVLANCRLVTAESHSGKFQLREGRAPTAAPFSFPVSFPTHHLVILISFSLMRQSAILGVGVGVGFSRSNQNQAKFIKITWYFVS